VTPGAGGYGPPAERAPEQKRRDIVEERGEAAAAASSYSAA
jgi:N-methylhydantoinase B/oxoprolinase/acetone carboxylase alpha subunit